MWRAEDLSDYILVAVHPGVGWQDVAIHLTAAEVETLRRSEEDFTAFVKTVVAKRDGRFRTRRIESQIIQHTAEVLEFPTNCDNTEPDGGEESR